ncbi:MAG: aldo/keto reductase [Bacteroidales bacterium]|nr:aldo/keto reductase [Bacteroidales bacterium]
MKSNKSINRRGFLKSSVIGTAGFVVGQKAFSEVPLKNKKQESSDQNFIYRNLGNTGIKLPIISMGVMRADNPNLVKAALEKGIVHLDTAHGYQDGKNEEMIGKVLKEFPRDSYIIATKVRPDGYNRRTGVFSEDVTEENFFQKFDISLKRLGLEYVDILYLHNMSKRESALNATVLNALKKAKKSGKARFVGISTHSNQPEVIEAAVESNVYDVVLTAYNFNLGIKDKLNMAIEKAARAGLGIVAMKTLAGGFLDRERQQPVNVKAALKWALQNPNVHTSIPGFTTFDQLDESLSVMNDLELTEDEKKDINLAQSIPGLYCLGCEDCLSQCKKNLPVPDIMRAYMYTYGYRELEKAHELLIALDLTRNPCKDCNSCSVVCAKGFDIAEKIKDVTRLLDVPADFIT